MRLVMMLVIRTTIISTGIDWISTKCEAKSHNSPSLCYYSHVKMRKGRLGEVTWLSQVTSLIEGREFESRSPNPASKFIITRQEGPQSWEALCCQVRGVGAGKTNWLIHLDNSYTVLFWIQRNQTLQRLDFSTHLMPSWLFICLWNLFGVLEWLL